MKPLTSKELNDLVADYERLSKRWYIPSFLHGKTGRDRAGQLLVSYNHAFSPKNKLDLLIDFIDGVYGGNTNPGSLRTMVLNKILEVNKDSIPNYNSFFKSKQDSYLDLLMVYGRI